ncbi:MAG TPA: pyrroloquinoline quinone biosynthesis protein PqqE [Acidisphaera sp.]|nr:pyrroloquinoline quinone biosynthesis protein PqqE [Acidisphaera sp.]
MTPPPPIGLLAELTHRCPLRCPYCSNPLDLVRGSDELSAAEWTRLFHEAAELGVLQVHLSGGEPAARRDLPEIVAGAHAAGLYTNLITSGVTLDEAGVRELARAGLDHVQLSVQDSEHTSADRIGGLPGGHVRKMAFAAAVAALDLALTLNAVVHKQNLDRLDEMIALALRLGADRLEIAHVQYHGWALANRDALLPSRAQLDAATALVARVREELRGRLVIDYVIPDYHAVRPKPCMGGWGQQVIVVTPRGRALPCHAAESLPGLTFENVRHSGLRAIWYESASFNRYRGTDWMQPPCRDCENAERDWGGCRCQAHALTGDAAATDPVCDLSPRHALVQAAVVRADASARAFVYRQFGNAPATVDA